jgi:DNA replication and repair protein RecF
MIGVREAAIGPPSSVIRPLSSAFISRLTLTNFRSYRSAQVETGPGAIVVVGANGAGKTNLIEAISFLAPGRGLRRATLEDVAFSEGDGSWAVSAEVEGALGSSTLGTGIEPRATDAGVPSRKCRINREPVASAAAFTDHLRVLWLTPAMDGLFNGPASERRRFLDRLVLAVDAEHGGRVAALERSLRSRNRLLEEARPDGHWLDAIEHETAELAVAVTALRVETVARLAGKLAARSNAAAPFPAAEIALDGWMEQRVPLHPAVEIEDRYRAVLRDNRARDAAAGRTLDGPHLTDLSVRHAGKGIAATDASTGEQKALLIGLVLAHAALTAEMTGFAPVILLDEVMAHLDPARRAALCIELDQIGAQFWMTGADVAAFEAFSGEAQIFEVTPGQVRRSPRLSSVPRSPAQSQPSNR